MTFYRFSIVSLVTTTIALNASFPAANSIAKPSGISRPATLSATSACGVAHRARQTPTAVRQTVQR